MQRFADRSVVITGAGSGIGRATAERLAAEGALLRISDVNEEGLEETAATCRESGATVTAVVSDVSDEAAVADLIGGAVAAHGRLDVLVNVAGILQFKDFRLTTLEDFNRIIGVNLTGTFLTCRDAMPHLLESQGNIVNITSTAALAGHPWTSSYSASKGGVLALTLTLAVEFGKMGVRCNAVAPGFVATTILSTIPHKVLEQMTERVPRRRLGTPEDIANVYAFLACDEASYINGAVIEVAGGLTV